MIKLINDTVIFWVPMAIAAFWLLLANWPWFKKKRKGKVISIDEYNPQKDFI